MQNAYSQFYKPIRLIPSLNPVNISPLSLNCNTVKRYNINVLCGTSM